MKVGDYVRTKKGYIGKAIIITEYNTNIEDKKVVNTKDIIKSSPRIIDLIQVGDYVDGCYIQEIKEIENNEMTCMLDSDYECYSHIKNEDIKSIVTKEQFESMEYKIESVIGE